MKKRVSSLFLILASLPFASAQYFSIEEGARQFVDGMKELFTPLFEGLLGTSSYDDFFFAKILLFFLLFIVIFAVMRKVELFEKMKGIVPLVALIISLLAVRYISEEGFFAGILLPYGALGIAVLTFLPFLIYFWFVHKSVKTGLGRRVAWILYAIVFVFLWGSRSSDISTESNWIYFTTLIIMFIVFAFDKSFKSYFRTHEIGKFKLKANEKVIAALQSEYLDILHVDTAEARNRRKTIEAHLNRFKAKLP